MDSRPIPVSEVACLKSVVQRKGRVRRGRKKGNVIDHSGGEGSPSLHPCYHYTITYISISLCTRYYSVSNNDHHAYQWSRNNFTLGGGEGRGLPYLLILWESGNIAAFVIHSSEYPNLRGTQIQSTKINTHLHQTTHSLLIAPVCTPNICLANFVGSIRWHIPMAFLQ